MFKKLSDADVACLKEGDTEIWYMRTEFFAYGILGYEFLKKKGMVPDPKNLNKTHVLMGKVKCADCEIIYAQMQGEVWSPHGEAREMLQEKGVDHTSMCVGDVVVLEGKVLLVDIMKFRELPQVETQKK